MVQRSLARLPSEIIINILSRLPIKTIINCKRVCKYWYELLNSPYFVTVHLSKSVPSLIVGCYEIESNFIKIFELEDELLHHQLEHNQGRHKLITKWEFPNENALMEGSVNGLLFLREISHDPDSLYICNPITHEVIELASPSGKLWYPTVVTYGFGASEISGEYKVVRIFHERKLDPDTQTLLGIPKSECQMYTLGTGSWRSVNPPGLEHEYNCRSNGTFLNGKLHWIVSDLKGAPHISCFDLETEAFTTFSPPPPPPDSRLLATLSVTGDCLYFCDNDSDDEIVIWVMKEYGVEKSWKKEFTIRKSPDFAGEHYEVIYPLKIFKDGDILMFLDDFYLFYYSHKTKSTIGIDMFELKSSGCLIARLHVSSFVSLRSFITKEIVKSY